MDAHASMAAGGNGGIEMDEIIIDGATYRVQKALVDEIVNLRRGTTHEVLDRIRKLEVEEGDTVLITVPDNASREFQMQVASLIRQNFPDHRGLVVPENLGLHTEKGVAELVETGMDMAMAVQDHNPTRALSKAHEFVGLVQGRKAEDESAEAGE